MSKLMIMQYQSIFLKSHNFNTTLPEYLAEQADEMIKSKYNLGFLGVAKPVREIELEKS